MGEVMNFFPKKSLDHEIVSSLLPGATGYKILFWNICKTLRPQHPLPLRHSPSLIYLTDSP